MEVIRIVITGGPCAGKSTAMSRLQSTFEYMGIPALFISETATELISGGVSPWSCGTNEDYQKIQMRWQLEKERLFYQAAMTMKHNRVVIVCDRGVMDNKAYMSDEEFDEVLKETNENEVELRDRYNAVFHMLTAAKGAAEYYTTINNTARRESVDEAVALDDKLISAWAGHPHLRIIDNSTDFDGKIKRLIHEILFFLGEPEPLEIERKYLIEYPDLDLLDALKTCKRVEISQTYMTTPENEQIRLRQRGSDGNYIYFLTSKKTITNVKRIETERRLTKDEYSEILRNTEGQKYELKKDRYCLIYQNQYFEIDVYPFWSDKAIMEIELSSEDDSIVFPDFIHIIREVTDEKEYLNSSIARNAVR